MDPWVLLLFWGWVSLCRPEWPGTHRDPLASAVGIKDTCHFCSTRIQWILLFHRCENRGSCPRHKQKSSLQLILQAFRERFCPLAKSSPLQVWKQHTETGFVQQRRPFSRPINNGPDHDFSKDEHSWLFFLSCKTHVLVFHVWQRPNQT